MWLKIYEQGLTVDPVVRDQVERRLGLALGQSGEHVGRVSVLLTVVNGPQGGEDKLCRVVVEVLGHGRVVVEDTDRDVQVAIEQTADRVGQAVRRQLDRAQLYASLTDPKLVGGQN